ncbi:four helix bundle protein [Winogradskyella pulchriflava]|uniref:Four helix bundle protein n=1 Tax=Winogradskyella pulchriflava TaxID=1110688 RepID=A0ABV6Q9X8_9FLAO
MKQQLKNRTQKYAADGWHLCTKFPLSREYNAFCNQLIRCSSSVGANYRAACRAKSDADFINKLKIVEEADESMYFLELLLQVSNKEHEEIKRLHKEGNELLAIVVTSIKTMRAKNRKS